MSARRLHQFSHDNTHTHARTHAPTHAYAACTHARTHTHIHTHTHAPYDKGDHLEANVYNRYSVFFVRNSLVFSRKIQLPQLTVACSATLSVFELFHVRNVGVTIDLMSRSKY